MGIRREFQLPENVTPTILTIATYHNALTRVKNPRETRDTFLNQKAPCSPRDALPARPLLRTSPHPSTNRRRQSLHRCKHHRLRPASKASHPMFDTVCHFCVLWQSSRFSRLASLAPPARDPETKQRASLATQDRPLEDHDNAEPRTPARARRPGPAPIFGRIAPRGIASVTTPLANTVAGAFFILPQTMAGFWAAMRVEYLPQSSRAAAGRRPRAGFAQPQAHPPHSRAQGASHAAWHRHRPRRRGAQARPSASAAMSRICCGFGASAKCRGVRDSVISNSCQPFNQGGRTALRSTRGQSHILVQWDRSMGLPEPRAELQSGLRGRNLEHRPTCQPCLRPWQTASRHAFDSGAARAFSTAVSSWSLR